MREFVRTNVRSIAGIAVAVVLAVLVVFHVWPNRSYIRLRFIGTGAETIDEDLISGLLTPNQVISLVTKGAVDDVRVVAVRTISMSDRFPAPYGPKTVRAILSFANNLPDDFVDKTWAKGALMEAVAKSGQPEFLPVVKRLAESPESQDRQLACSAFTDGHDFGDEGVRIMGQLASDRNAVVKQYAAFALGCSGSQAALPLLKVALADADAEVRGRAAVGVRALHLAGVDVRPLVPRLREILESASEPEDNRTTAMAMLCWVGQMRADDLNPYVDDHHPRVAEEARDWQTRLRADEQRPPNPGMERASDR